MIPEIIHKTKHGIFVHDDFGDYKISHVYPRTKTRYWLKESGRWCTSVFIEPCKSFRFKEDAIIAASKFDADYAPHKEASK